MRVLHVVESYGAGTASAVLQYVRATPDLEHHLVRRLRHDGDHADDGELAHFASVTEMATGTLPAIRSVRGAVATVRPDVVHGHSSFGGAFARTAVRRGRRAPLLVHTPHCYATERRDLGRLARAAYATAERLLALNTDVVAGCSPRETDLGRRVAPRARHVFVPNVTDVVAHHAGAASDRPVVTGMGRLTAQRDPLAFLEVVRALSRRLGQGQRQGRPVTARWIGDGSAPLAARLEAAGVEVTGWLPRTAALRLMGESAVYVHTARWDGAPMTMIEAHALRLPQVALRSPAVADGPAGAVADRVEDLAALVARLLEDEGERRDNLAAWDGYFKACTPERQRDALLEAYGSSDGGVTR